jgi:hypothetical protein
MIDVKLLKISPEGKFDLSRKVLLQKEKRGDQDPEPKQQ